MPVDVSINEEIIPLSHASMTLRSGDSIPERSYVELFTPNGSAGIYRSRVPREGYGDLSVNIELEHAIVEVGDYLFKESLEAELGLSEAFTRAFSHYGGDLWRLGSIPNDMQVILNADHDNVLEVMLDLLEQAPQYYMTFDFSVRPWKINVVQKPMDISAEGRLSRNVKSARISKDDSNLCTRLFMEGLPKAENESIGHIDADTIGIYGLVEREISGSKDYTEAQAMRVAETYLEANKHPRLSVSINGIDFSSITGESIDRIALGKRYRLVVDGVSTEENITAIAWNSVYNDPMSVTITVAQGEDTIIEFMHNQDKKTRKVTKANEELYWEMTSEDGLLHATISATEKELRTEYTEAIANTDTKLSTRITQNARSITLEAERASTAEGVLQGKITVEADRITQEVTARKDGEATLQGKITVQADRITAEVTRATTAEGTLSGRITVEANRITNEVTRAIDEERALRGALEVEADRVSMVVGTVDTRPIRYVYQTQYLPRPGDPSVIYYCQDSKKYYEWNPSTNSYIRTEPGKFIKAGEIVESINEAGETEAHIDADKVYIGNSKSTTVINGKLNASDFTATNISAQLATLAQVTVNGLNVIGDVYVRNGAGSQQNVAGAIWDIQLTGPVNNVYTLKRRRINESDYTDIGTFSRATSLSGQWSGGELTVTASPQGNKFRADLFTGGHWGYASGEDKKTYYGSISAKHNGGSTSYSTGEYFEVDASSIYDDGYDEGYDEGYDLGLDDGWYAYYDSSKWEAPSSSNGWKAKIPTRASSSQNETWLTLTNYSQWHPNSLSMYCTEGGQVPGTQIYRYKFTVEASSNWGYVAGKSYPFYY